MAAAITSGEDFDVCVIGLGYVGLTLATAFADRGLTVAGTERIPEVVATLQQGESSFYEKGLSETLAAVVKSGALQVFSTADRLPRAKAYVVTVGTPLRDGEVHFTDLEDALHTVAAGMPTGALVVLRSTVRIGITSDVATRVLDASGKNYLLAMAPERTVEGKALIELSTLPQIVGGINPESTQAASELFARLGAEIVPVARPEEAEFAKLVSNTWRDLQFAFANELAYLADTAGVDVYEVIKAAGYKYDRLTLALPGPVAGPCLEKDAYILDNSAQHYAAEVPLSLTGRKVNEKIVSHVASLAAQLTPHHTMTKVAILGLAFKGRPATADTRGSLAGNFAASWRDMWPRAEILGWDPLVSSADAAAMGIKSASLGRAVSGAQLVLLQTNHADLASAEVVAELRAMLAPGTVVIDLWNQTADLAAARSDITVKVLGRLPRSENPS